MLLRDKPWYKSLTVAGVLTSVLGVLVHPAVFAVLPPKVATAIGAIGGAVSVLGIRRALPARDTTADTLDLPEGAQEWADTFDAQGLNPYGETRDDVRLRRERMAAVADDNRKFLMGVHYTPKS